METDHHSLIKWCFACYICCRHFWPHLHWRRFSVSRNDSFVSGFSSAMAAARNINQPWFFVLGCFNQCNGVRLKTQLATFFSTRKPSQVILYSLWNPCLIFTFHWYSLIDTHWILLVLSRREGCDRDVWRYLLNTWCWCWCWSWSSYCCWCWTHDI